MLKRIHAMVFAASDAEIYRYLVNKQVMTVQGKVDNRHVTRCAPRDDGNEIAFAQYGVLGFDVRYL